MKKLKIAIISKLWESTSPFSTGGTGASVGQLVDELVKRGHRVTLFATDDSKTQAKLISVRQKPWHEDYSEPIEYLNIAQAFSSKRHFDIIHCHVEQKACFLADCTNTPTIINIRYGEFFNDEITVLKKNKYLNYVAISKSIKKLLPFLNWQDVIYNGINLKLFPFNDKPQKYLLFLARLSPQKGPDVAIKVAKKLNCKLILAGKMVNVDKDYLEKKIIPHIDNKQIKYIGLANFSKKIKLLRNASALLHPINYTEAFGMSLIESMACGTPVISFDSGSPREIIENQKTGFIVNNTHEMINAARNINLINRERCRQRVEKYFTVEKMTDQYEKLYRRLIS